MRRGLRGGAHNYPPPDDEPVAPGTSARLPETASRKFVQGIPALYSRASKKANGAIAGASDAGDGDADVTPLGTAERLLQAAQQREAAEPPPAAAPAPHAANERQPQRQQESALQARLRAMVSVSFCLSGCVSVASSAATVCVVVCVCTCPCRDAKSTKACSAPAARPCRHPRRQSPA